MEAVYGGARTGVQRERLLERNAALGLAQPDAPRRAALAGLLASIALTSFLTGVIEPVEFTFMFLAPGLYLVRALLTGLAFIITNALDVRLGLGFSAGLFDCILNYKYASHRLRLLPIGAAYFALYYEIFRIAIAKLDLKTPGREAEGQPLAAKAPLRPPVSGHSPTLRRWRS